MKKPVSKAKAKQVRSRAVAKDDILPEYDFSRARRNPYAARFAAGVILVALDPDVAATFPDAAAVNEALRALARIVHRAPKRTASKRRTA
jgi:hypothetical protein